MCDLIGWWSIVSIFLFVVELGWICDYFLFFSMFDEVFFVDIFFLEEILEKFFIDNDFVLNWILN